MTKKIGLISGSGALPLLALKHARDQGYKTYVLAIKGQTDPNIGDFCDKVKWIDWGKFRPAITFLVLNRIKNLIFLGKILKQNIYQSSVDSDNLWQEFVTDLPDHRDDTLLLKAVHHLKKLGFSVLDSTLFLKDCLMGEGFLIDAHCLTSVQKEDVLFGIEIAKVLSGFDIGQTVVIKNKNVVAVEAMEGTDLAIQRAVSLVRSGCVVVKVAKPSQDNRFDVPTVGVNTLKNLENISDSVLVLEAYKTILVNKEEMISWLKTHSVVVLGVRCDEKKS